jgi:hypothetical protein
MDQDHVKWEALAPAMLKLQVVLPETTLINYYMIDETVHNKARNYSSASDNTENNIYGISGGSLTFDYKISR